MLHSIADLDLEDIWVTELPHTSYKPLNNFNFFGLYFPHLQKEGIKFNNL